MEINSTKYSYYTFLFSNVLTNGEKMRNNYANNIVNLNAVKRKIYDNFNYFHHNTAPSTNPIEQRDILVGILAHTPELSCAERDILACIVSNTVCRGFYYTFITQQDIANEIGCSRRTVIRAYKKLQEMEWIRYQRTSKYTRRNITDFNVDKAMVLGKKSKTAHKCHVEKSQSDTVSPQKENYKSFSKEKESYRTEPCSMEQEILERVKIKQKPKKPRMTGHSLGRTWKSAASENPDCTKMQSTFTDMDRNKLGKLTGDSRSRGKWFGSTAELHEMTHFCVKNWDYCCRWFKTSKMPKIPSVGWYVACFDTFYEIWLKNQPKESVVVDITNIVKSNAEKRKKKVSKDLLEDD